jgi:hypothetical protein
LEGTDLEAAFALNDILVKTVIMCGKLGRLWLAKLIGSLQSRSVTKRMVVNFERARVACMFFGLGNVRYGVLLVSVKDE